jgi:hypothetical protein
MPARPAPPPAAPKDTWQQVTGTVPLPQDAAPATAGPGATVYALQQPAGVPGTSMTPQHAMLPAGPAGYAAAFPGPAAPQAIFAAAATTALPAATTLQPAYFGAARASPRGAGVYSPAQQAAAMAAAAGELPNTWPQDPASSLTSNDVLLK